MAHPSNAFPKEFVLINGAETVTGEFFAIHVLIAADANMTVKASGIHEQLAADASNGSTHLANGDTPADQQTNGVLNATHDAGRYERLSTVDTILPCVSGNTIYGNFNTVTGTSGDQFIVYMK